MSTESVASIGQLSATYRNLLDKLDYSKSEYKRLYLYNSGNKSFMWSEGVSTDLENDYTYAATDGDDLLFTLYAVEQQGNSEFLNYSVYSISEGEMKWAGQINLDSSDQGSTKSVEYIDGHFVIVRPGGSWLLYDFYDNISKFDRVQGVEFTAITSNEGKGYLANGNKFYTLQVVDNQLVTSQKMLLPEGYNITIIGVSNLDKGPKFYLFSNNYEDYFSVSSNYSSSTRESLGPFEGSSFDISTNFTPVDIRILNDRILIITSTGYLLTLRYGGEENTNYAPPASIPFKSISKHGIPILTPATPGKVSALSNFSSELYPEIDENVIDTLEYIPRSIAQFKDSDFPFNE